MSLAGGCGVPGRLRRVMRESKASSAYSFIGRSTRGKKNGHVTQTADCTIHDVHRRRAFRGAGADVTGDAQQTGAPTVTTEATNPVTVKTTRVGTGGVWHVSGDSVILTL